MLLLKFPTKEHYASLMAGFFIMPLSELKIITIFLNYFLGRMRNEIFCMSFTYVDYGKTRETIKHANGI